LENSLSSSSDETSSTGGNQTSLLTSRGVSSNSSGVTDVLMVTTSMGMLNGVHSNTSNSWPPLVLRLGLEVGSVCLKEGLVSSLSAGNDADHASAGSLDGLSDSRWELDSGLLSIFRVTNNNDRGTRSSSEGATVSEFGLEVGDDSAFGHRVNWENIAYLEGCFGSGIDELSSVHSFNSDEIRSTMLVFVLVSENNLGKRSSSARVVYNVLNNALNVPASFGKVQSSESGWGDSVIGITLEHSGSSVSLS